VIEEEFIELNRTFFELPRDYSPGAERDNFDLYESLELRSNKDLNWEALLAQYRTILLAEAGAGKTEEIRQAARKLRSERKAAFFIRLESILGGLESAFEEGNFQEFEEWLSSDDEGWLFLDSVDEAKLKHAQDFDQAIRSIAYKLHPALQRVHIVITSRVDAWRAITDLKLCDRQLKYSISNKEDKEEEEEEYLSHDDEDVSGDEIKIREDAKSEAGFKIYSISKLSPEQIKAFICCKGINDAQGFLQEVERQEAWEYTRRPQDLLELVDFWDKNEKIGTRSELIENSVERRLDERRENAAAANPISLNKIRDGVQLIALASVLMKEAIIRVPDGSENTVGIDSRSLLPDWDKQDLDALLSRPIFAHATYGSVRFHHRSVKEYLVAKWFQSLLEQGASRKAVENSFFQKKYGLTVIVPSMRVVLSWLVLFDDRIRDKACKIEPEIIFESGDPSKLPVKIRREMLQKVCSKMEAGTSSGSVTDYSAVQRFATPDLADDIKLLIAKYKNNTEITCFLMRMIWQGHIKQALPEAQNFALGRDTEKYTRIAAIRAVKEIGRKEDFQEILDAFLEREAHIDRRLLAEIVDRLDASQEAVEWIVQVLEKVKDKEKHSSDGLSYSLVRFSERLDMDIMLFWVKRIDGLLERTPVIERRFCEVSERFGWLINCGARAVKKMVASQHPDAMAKESLSILAKIPPFNDYADFENKELVELSELVGNWTELKFAMFWKNVEVARESEYFKDEKRLTYFWQAHTLRSYWNFEEDDFERTRQYITERELLDDKLVALSLAFQIYKEHGRKRQWRDQLKRDAQERQELENRLEDFLKPPPQSAQERKWKQQEARWRRQNKKRKAEREKYHVDWAAWLKENSEKLRDEGFLKKIFSKNRYLNAQYYLLERMRKLRNESTHWTQGNWRDLIDGYGEDIALAFRDGLLLSWKFYQPKLRSEQDDADGTPIPVILGLSGLAIEAEEVPGWPAGLSEDGARLACRYAFQELNGFPNWFFKLHEKFPDVVSDCILTEIEWELATQKEGQEKHYIIDKVSWNGQFLWDKIAPDLLGRLEKLDLTSVKYLGSLLKIIQESSTVSDQEIAHLAEQKCGSLDDADHISYWFATWIGVEPSPAIKKFSKYLKNIEGDVNAVQLAMQVIVNLIGDRRTGAHARERYKTPKYLQDLYLLMHRYIKIEEDIDRAGKGVYTPQLRDNAQEARSGIFSILTEIPGEESYSSLVYLAKKHPAKIARPWMIRQAKVRAEKDADLTTMTNKEFSIVCNSLHSSTGWARFLELKPNFYGVGVNLNEVWLSLRKRWKW